MTAAIHVMMVLSRFSPAVGGTERQALLLAQPLMQRDVHVQVLTHRYDKSLSKNEKVEGVEVIRVGIPGTSVSASLSYVIAGLRCIALMPQPPDLFHGHMIASSAVLATLAGKIFNRPSIVKVACSGPYGDVATSTRTWSGRQKLSWVLKNTDRLVSLSADSDRELLAQGVKPDRVQRLVNGVDTKIYKPAGSVLERKSMRRQLGLPEGFLILFVGRLTAQKRPDLLLEAFQSLVSGNESLQIVFLGDGPLRSSLEEKAKSGPGANRILFAGNRQDISSYYQASDCFVLPSESEGMSNSLLEAMASGLPCIANAYGGASEMIADGVSGFLYRNAGVDELRNLLQRLINDSTIATVIGQRARTWVETQARIDDVADRYKEMYQSLIVGTTR